MCHHYTRHLQITSGDLERVKLRSRIGSRQQHLEEKSLELNSLVSETRLFFSQQKVIMRLWKAGRITLQYNKYTKHIPQILYKIMIS